MTEKRQMKKSKYGNYYTIPFSKNRDIVEDFITLGKKAMRVYALGEIDVTEPLKKIKELKENGIDISFSAYITYIFAKTVAEHPYMQAIKWRRRKMVVFEDVDVSFLVERVVKGVKMPTMVMIRKADKKSILDITNEIRGAQKIQDDSMVDKEKEGGSSQDLLLKIPRFLRKILFTLMFRNPFLRRQYDGTVGITSVGMYAEGGGTSVPIAIENLALNVGGIEKKPGYVKDENGEYDTSRIEPRDYLWITVAIDHTTNDGGPITRFIGLCRERLRNSYGLDEIKIE
ncbi:MAG: hypothetical protein FK734_19550 [Asgard group archaeon]|nr:hypothetical protein [Asgard group archaeon]